MVASPLSRRAGWRRLWAPVAALIAVAGLGLVGSSAFGGTTSVGSIRLAGADRFATAAAVSQATYPDGAPIAYVATGLDFPDALAAAAAAGGHGPVLLTLPDSVPPATSSELARLHPHQVDL